MNLKSTLRNVALTLLAILGMSLHQASAQNKTVIKINPASLFGVTANLQVERAISPNMSFQLGGYYGGVKFGFLGVGDAGIRWWSLTPEFRYYINPAKTAAPSGFYASGFFRYRNLRGDLRGEFSDPDLNVDLEGTAHLKLDVFSIGGTIGYQFLIGDAFAVDFFIGPQVNLPKIGLELECSQCNGNESFNIPNWIFSPVGLRAGMSIGIAF
jgi:hypothetical protein